VIIDVRGLVVRRGGRTILGPIDWQIADGERWVVLGANGSGKTTLLSAVGLTLWPTAGTVDVLGSRYGKVDSRELRRRIGAASSAVEQELLDRLTPADLVMSAINAATEPWWHEYGDDDRRRTRLALERLGLTDVADQSFGTLSAGERRRVSIARALVPDPDVLLLDEPAASLDLAARETLLADLSRLAAGARPSAMVLVSHHVEEIPPGFDRALVLAAGRIVAMGPIEDVVRGDVLSAALHVPLVVEHRDGRIWARLDPAADTRPSHGGRTIAS